MTSLHLAIDDIKFKSQIIAKKIVCSNQNQNTMISLIMANFQQNEIQTRI